MLKRIDFGNANRNCPVDMTILEGYVKNFLVKTNVKKLQYIPYVDCVNKARVNLTNARILLLSLTEPEHNKYIQAIDEKYKTQGWLADNIGRIEKFLDEKAKNIEQIKNSSDFLREPNAPFRMKEYLSELINIFSHLVYFPTIRATERYNNFVGTLDGVPIQKDKELFQYFLYLEIYNGAKSLGHLTREQGMGRAKSTSMFPNYQNLPRVPMNVRTIEDESELPPEEDSQIEEYFIDDFQDETVQEEENQD